MVLRVSAKHSASRARFVHFEILAGRTANARRRDRVCRGPEQPEVPHFRQARLVKSFWDKKPLAQGDLAMASAFAAGATVKPGLFEAAMLVMALFVLSQAPAGAQVDSKTGATADTEFSQQLGELKKSFADVGRTIDESAKSIDTVQNPEQGRKSIEELRDQVSTLLNAVADNGEISRLGAKALSVADEKLKSLDRETRFKPEEKQYLVNRWRELKTATEAAIRDLDGARKDFSELLRTLQTSEDYINELMQIREHEKALQVIRQLSDSIRDASVKLKKLLGTIQPPGV
jgi:hypothetical protein